MGFRFRDSDAGWGINFSLRQNEIGMRNSRDGGIWERWHGSVRHRKIPLINPGPIQLREGFWVAFLAEGGGAYIRGGAYKPYKKIASKCTDKK